MERCKHCQAFFRNPPSGHQKGLCLTYVSMLKYDPRFAEEVWKALKSDDENFQKETLIKSEQIIKNFFKNKDLNTQMSKLQI